jgi:hypothetical protein
LGGEVSQIPGRDALALERRAVMRQAQRRETRSDDGIEL